MRYRRLGTTEPQISEIGFGASYIGGEQGPGSSDDEFMRALTRAFELGVTFVDTAPDNGDRRNEQLVGRALKRSIHRVFVATKIPPLNHVWTTQPAAPMEQVFPYDHIIRSTEESLRNLRIEQIYLQQFHVWNDSWASTGEWRRAIEDLRTSGKVRFGICLSAQDPDSGLEAIKTGLLNSVQVVYNVFDQSAEKNLFPLCLEKKVGVLARAPLDAGGLTGAITAGTVFDAGGFRVKYFAHDRQRQLVEHVEALKRDLAGVPGTLAEIALRFCLSHPAVTSAVPGLRRVATVESSCRASTAGRLNAAILTVLRRHAWSRNFYQETETPKGILKETMQAGA